MVGIDIGAGLPDPYADDHQPDVDAIADLIWALKPIDRQRLSERLGLASGPPIDVRRLARVLEAGWAPSLKKAGIILAPESAAAQIAAAYRREPA